jgi:hypothetical protein
MQRARGQFLASASFSRDDHGGSPVGYQPNGLADLNHFQTVADQQLLPSFHWNGPRLLLKSIEQGGGVLIGGEEFTSAQTR